MSHLYPPITPHWHTMLPVSKEHTIYVEECGNPDGIPVIVLHGGPGGGCNANMRRVFDPKAYKIILFDQRGCGRSTPVASVDENTTWDLIKDIETIRELRGINQWAVFGGSWGATLGLLYAQQHPSHVLHLILRGVFALSNSELNWFYGGKAQRFWPNEWHKFASMVPKSEQDNLIKAYHNRLFSGDLEIELKFSHAWANWEMALASLNAKLSMPTKADQQIHAFARLENHYFINGGFLTHDRQIFDNMALLNNINGTIIQGRYDMICPPETACEIHSLWKKSKLHMIPNSGHAMSEPEILKKLISTMDILKETLPTDCLD